MGWKGRARYLLSLASFRNYSTYSKQASLLLRLVQVRPGYLRARQKRLEPSTSLRRNSAPDFEKSLSNSARDTVVA